MKVVGLWRRASGKPLGWRGGVAAPGPGRPRQQGIKLFSDVDTWQQQTRRLRSTSDRFGSGAMAGCHFLRPLGVRHFSFSSSSSAAAYQQVSRYAGEGLLHVLRCEIEDLTKKDQNITARKPPKPFAVVKDEPGELEMTLTRIYGLEDISMSCVLQIVPQKYQRKPEIGEDPEARTKMLQLSISIVKGGPYPILKMKCECYRDGFAIHQVDLESEDEEQSVYRPYFSSKNYRMMDKNTSQRTEVVNFLCSYSWETL